MFKLEVLETPQKSHLLNRTGSRGHKSTHLDKPVRLSAYHQERKSSRSKLFENEVVNSPWKKANNDVSGIKDLHRNLQKLITAFIAKLEDKRRSLMESYEEAELRAAERIITNWSQILSKNEPKMTTSCFPLQTPNPQKLEPPTEIRFRGATFSSIPTIFGFNNFQLEVPTINVSYSNSKSTSGQSCIQKEFDMKSTSSNQMDKTEELDATCSSPVKKLSSFSAVRPSPLKIQKKSSLQ